MSAAQPGRAHVPPIRVLVVDDSAVVRGLTVRILASDASIEVTGTCANGQIAVQHLERHPADVVILDVEMPVMDGLTALPLLLKACPHVRVIVASTLTQRNAEISLQALAKGAADYIPKPSTGQLGSNEIYRRDLLQKVNALGRRVASARRVSTAAQPHSPARTAMPRKAAQAEPHALFIGSSTGGPQALMTLLAALPPSLQLPIFIAQHMPAAFTPVLAQHLAKAAGRACHEAEDGLRIEPGGIYLARGGFHLEILRASSGLICHLTSAEPEHFCRPSVNPLLRSAAQTLGRHALAAMLTGMGSDGLEGATALVAAGGTLLAQDEESSVVWGMPGAVVGAGLCAAVLPLARLAPEIARLGGIR